MGGQLHGGQVVLVCHQDVGGGVHQPHPGYQHLGERKRNLVAVASRSLPFFGRGGWGGKGERLLCTPLDPNKHFMIRFSERKLID